MELLSEQLGVIGTIDPQTLADTEVFSDVIDMSKYNRIMCIFQTGDMNGSTGSLVARCVTCDSGGTNAAAFKTATTIAAASSDNKQVIIEVDQNDLAEGGTNANRYVKFGAVSGTTGGPVSAVVLGESKHRPSTNDDLSTVNEIEIDAD